MTAVFFNTSNMTPLQEPRRERVHNAQPQTRALSHPYLGQGWTNLPSALNIFYIPRDLINTIRDGYRAESLGDTEGVLENILRISELPFNVSSTLLNGLDWSTRIISYFETIHSASIPALSKKLPILGIIMCSIESLIEAMGIKGARSMLHQLDMSELDKLESLKEMPHHLEEHFLDLLRNPTELKRLLSDEDFKVFSQAVNSCFDPDHPLAFLSAKQIETLNAWRETLLDKLIFDRLTHLRNAYCTDTPEKTKAIDALVRKKFPKLSPEDQLSKADYYTQLSQEHQDRHLIRRLYPRAAHAFHEQMPRLIQDMQLARYADFPNPRERALDFLTDLKTQSHKKYLLHTVGLLAAAITIAGFIAILCFCPYLIPLILVSVGGGLSCIRYAINEGMMHTKGWSFDSGNLVPDWMKSLYHKIFTRSIPANS